MSDINNITPLNSTNESPDKEINVGVRNIKKSVWKVAQARSIELGIPVGKYLEKLIAMEAGLGKDINNQ